MKTLKVLAAALAAVALTACVHKAEVPPLAGPSGFATSISLAASPDSISHDGGSQSRITVTVFGPDGKPFSRPPSLRLDMFVNGQQQDYGTLSARTVVPNGNGEVVAVYTSPPPPPGSVFPTCGGLAGTCVEYVATGIGNSFETVAPQSVMLRLVPPGVILPPAGTPTAAFTFSPSSVSAKSAVIFDASNSQIGSGATQIVDYSWNFGDGGSGTGRSATHIFGDPGTFNVTLTITNDRGLTSSNSQAITVAPGALPSPKFTVSPASPNVNEPVFFNGTTSTPGAGHSIVGYSWNFGDGTPPVSGATVSHAFASAASFKVQLTVTDEAGQSVTSDGTDVVVGNGNPTASFTASIFNAGLHSMTFDGTGSTARSPATIATYAWAFGDGAFGSGPTPGHAYAVAGTYQVRLTVTDTLGRPGTVTQAVTVP